jgi:hypothetical protein
VNGSPSSQLVILREGGWLLFAVLLPRHCERSEAIHLTASGKNGLLRRCAPRNDGTIRILNEKRRHLCLRFLIFDLI